MARGPHRSASNGRAASNEQQNDGVPPELHTERATSVRLLAKERDIKKKLQATVTGLKQQLAAATAELERTRGQFAAFGDPKARLAAVKDEIAMLKSRIEERQGQLAAATHEYKGLEDEVMGLHGAAAHPAEVAKRGAMAKATQQRVKADKKTIRTMERQEAALQEQVDELRRQLESCMRSPGQSPSKASPRSPRAQASEGGATEESLVDVQLAHERRRKAALDALQAELARADKELERRREQLEAQEERERQQHGARCAKAEQARAAAQREHQDVKQQLADATARAEQLRAQHAAVDREIASSSQQCDACDVEHAAQQRRMKELQGEVDALLQREASASAAVAAGDAAWAREKQQLQASLEAATRRTKALKAEQQKAKAEIRRLQTELDTLRAQRTGAGGVPADVQGAVAQLERDAKEDNAAADKMYAEAAAANAEADALEQTAAVSQRDAIIEQQRERLNTFQSENAAVEKENAATRAKLEHAEGVLAKNGMSIDG